MERKLRSKLPAKFTFMLAGQLQQKWFDVKLHRIGPLCDYHEHAQDEATRKECGEAMKAQTIDWEAVERSRQAWYAGESKDKGVKKESQQA